MPAEDPKTTPRKLRRPGLLLAPAVLAPAMLLSACTGAQQTEVEPQEPELQEEVPPETEEPQQEPPESGSSGEGGSEGPEIVSPDDAGASEDAGGGEEAVTAAGEPAVVRDGVWAVGDAGEVEFTFEEGVLTLVDARASEGWRVDVDEQDPDEIEVDFERGNVEWEFEVETDGRELEIEIDQDIDPAEPGSFDVGNAGTVEISLDESGLSLVEARPNEGWSYVVDEDTPEEVEVEFARGNVEWDFDAELDDGVLDVEIDQEISGPVE